MGLFDAFKKKRIEKEDQEYEVDYSTIGLKLCPSVAPGTMDPDAEEDYQTFLKADKEGYQVKNLCYLLNAAKEGHPEANRLVRERIYKEQYEQDKDYWHYTWYRHLYRCAEIYKFDWAIKEFNRMIVDEEAAIQEEEKKNYYTKVENCSISQNEIDNIIANIKSTPKDYDKQKLIYEATKQGYYFHNAYDLVKNAYLSNTGSGHFYAIDPAYFILNKKDFATLMLMYLSSGFNSNTRPKAEQGLRELANSSNKIEDKVPLATFYIYVDPTPTKITKALMIYKEATEKGDRAVAEHYKNDTDLFTRKDAGDAWSNVSRKYRYNKPFDLFYALQCYKQGGLYEEGAEFINEFISEGGYENNTAKLFGDNDQFLKTVKEFDTKVYGAPQFKYDLEVRQVFVPSKKDIDVNEFFNMLFDEFMKRDGQDWGLPSGAISSFNHIKSTFTKGQLDYLVLHGKRKVIFNFQHTYRIDEFVEFAKASGAYPSLLSSSMKNENSTYNNAVESYEYARNNEGFAGSFDDYLKKMNMTFIKDPIKGAERKCAQQWWLDRLTDVYDLIVKKYNLLYKGKKVKGLIVIDSIKD